MPEEQARRQVAVGLPGVTTSHAGQPMVMHHASGSVINLWMNLNRDQAKTVGAAYLAWMMETGLFPGSTSLDEAMQSLLADVNGDPDPAIFRL